MYGLLIITALGDLVLDYVWPNFLYNTNTSSRGECNHPAARVKACQEPGSQFLEEAQHFSLHYKSCPGITDSYDASKARIIWDCKIPDLITEWNYYIS